MQEEIIATIPQESPESRLEVVLIQDGAGSDTVELRRLLWGEGIGWYRLHTLRLDRAAVKVLFRTLKQAQNRLEKGPANGRGKVIPFPVSQRAREKVSQRAV